MSNWFNRLPEQQARHARWTLLIGWLLLIFLLLKPELGPGYRSSVCLESTICRPGMGNDIFWNIGLPLVILAV